MESIDIKLGEREIKKFIDGKTNREAMAMALIYYLGV